MYVCMYVYNMPIVWNLYVKTTISIYKKHEKRNHAISYQIQQNQTGFKNATTELQRIYKPIENESQRILQNQLQTNRKGFYKEFTNEV